MAQLAYLDFDLRIERTAQGYRAEADSPAGQAACPFNLPYSDLEIENFLLKIGLNRGGLRRIESPEMEAAKAFGARLFAALFDDEIRAAFRSSLDEATRQGLGLRIRLRLIDVPELATLPWEYLYNPALNRFLALATKTPIVRYLDLPDTIRPLMVSPPLQILALISSPRDYPALDVEREWTKLRTALGTLEQRGLVVLERLEQATLAALQQRLRRGACHILHFIGHGGFDAQADDGVLLLEDEGGNGERVSGQNLGTLLYNHDPLRLAVLNACEGARASRKDPFSGVAQSLVQQGTPAVIAMQFAISDPAAISLTAGFYGSVADGYAVDAALTEARLQIFAENTGVEWGTPVLYMRAPDGKIFDITGGGARAAPTIMAPMAAAPATAEKPPAGPRDTASVASPAKRLSRRSMLLGLAAASMLVLLIGALIVPRWLRDRGIGGGPTSTTVPAVTRTGVVELVSTAVPRPSPTASAESGATTATEAPATLPATNGAPTAPIAVATNGAPAILGRIAFVSRPACDAAQPFSIYAVSVGGEPVAVAKDADLDSFHPSWSPDGQRLVFVKGHGGARQEEDIYTIGLDGSGEQRLTYELGDRDNDFDPDWSPDGARIVYVRGQGGHGNIRILNLSNQTSQERSQGGNDSSPVWSPNGQQIAFVRGQGNAAELYLMNADGSGQPHRLTTNAVEETEPAWSPSGQRLAFKRANDIYIMNTDGSDAHNLTPDSPRYDAHPSWSPDGKRITFFSDRAGSNDIYVLDVGQNELPRNITGSFENRCNNNPAWSR